MHSILKAVKLNNDRRRAPQEEGPMRQIEC
jgi:hypothetical protein